MDYGNVGNNRHIRIYNIYNMKTMKYTVSYKNMKIHGEMDKL